MYFFLPLNRKFPTRLDFRQYLIHPHRHPPLLGNEGTLVPHVYNRRIAKPETRGDWGWGEKRRTFLNSDQISSELLPRTVLKCLSKPAVLFEGFFTSPHSLMLCHALPCSGWGRRKNILRIVFATMCQCAPLPYCNLSKTAFFSHFDPNTLPTPQRVAYFSQWCSVGAPDWPRDLSPPEPSPAVWAPPPTACWAARLRPCPCTCPGPSCRAEPWWSQRAGQRGIAHDDVTLPTGVDRCRRGGEGYLKANRKENVWKQKLTRAKQETIVEGLDTPIEISLFSFIGIAVWKGRQRTTNESKLNHDVNDLRVKTFYI